MQLGLRVTEKDHSSRQIVYIVLIADVNLIEEYTDALDIPGNEDYFSL